MNQEKIEKNEQQSAVAEAEKTMVISVDDPAGAQDQTTERIETEKKLLTSFFTNAHSICTKNPTENGSSGSDHAEVTDTSRLSDLDQYFRTIRSFASGGQGILFHGEDLFLHRKVAIKTLHPQLCGDAESREKFIEEAQITSQLDHPAIVPIHSLHRQGENGLSVTMKMIHGKNFHSYLDEIIRKYEEFGFSASLERKALRFRLEIFLKICDALEYAHNHNIMHCDLKLDNIMIGEYHEAYLMDWGIAHPIRSKDYDPENWKHRKNAAGTIGFIAPETIRGDYSDQRADIYSMGLVLFEIVTLNKGISGKTMSELIQKARNHELNPVKHRFGCAIDRDLKAIIHKASEVRPEDRYQNIADLSSDLRKYLRQEEVSANPDNLFRKIFRSCIVRHGTALAITTLICLLAFVGLASYKLFDLLQSERIETIRKDIIERQFINALDTAHLLDTKLTDMEHNLTVCAHSLLYNIQNPGRRNEKRYAPLKCTDRQAGGKLPASFRFYPQYGFYLSYAHPGYLDFPGLPPEDRKKLLEVSALMAVPMQDVILNSSLEKDLTPENRAVLMRKMLQGDLPVSQVYFTFSSGFFLNYPAKLHAKNYDPRKRGWYQDRIKPGSPEKGWTIPYLDSSRSGLVMTYTLRMKSPFGNDGKLVAALDLGLTKLFDLVCRRSKEEILSGILEKAVIDSSGAIIMTSNPQLNAKAVKHYRISTGGKSSGFIYPQKDLLRRMRWSAKGTWSQKENGREIIYIYSKCKKINGFFLKKVDMEQRIQYRQSHEDR